MAAQKHVRIKLREINRHLVCRLCRGYYVDATTIAECLHSFCRSCIIKYLEKNSFCPICEVQIHKTKPYLNLRLDKALQDVVYKVVPGLYHDEMKRRRDFYSKRQEQIPFATPEQCGLEERIIFSPEDSISLSLEYLESDDYESETVSSQSSESGDNPDVLSFPQQLGLIKLKNGEGKASRRESQDVQETSLFPKRYLQCPAVVNIGHLKKFIRMKHDVTDKMQVSIVHKRVSLPDHYTLMDVAYIYTWKRSAPLRFFYQIYRTKKHNLAVIPPLQEAKRFKPQTIAEDLKSLKGISYEKHRADDAVNLGVKNNQSAKSSADISNASTSEFIKTVCGDVLNHVDGNKPFSESGRDKFEVIKSEPSEDSIKKEAKHGSGVGLDADKGSMGCKTEKSKAVSVSEQENISKEESHKRKRVKLENNMVGKQDVKDTKMSSERFLLNPVSGQLESVPSSDVLKSPANNGMLVEGSKESTDCTKSEIISKGQKSTKDSKKSGVNLLKSFRKEKFLAGKEDKCEVKKSKGNSLTITAVSKHDKPLEKETANFSVEIKAENKESEYDFDGSSPPSKITPLQYSKFSQYMADHRDKWLSKDSKNKWMSLKDFREKMLKENNALLDPLKKNKKKLVPSLYRINSEKNKTPIGKIPSEKPNGEKWKGSKIPQTVINIQTKADDKKEDLKGEVVPEKAEYCPKPKKVANTEKNPKMRVEIFKLPEKIKCLPKSKIMENKDGEKNTVEEKDKSSAKQENGETNCETKRQPNDGNKFIPAVRESSKDIVQEKTESESLKNKLPNSEARKNDLPGAMDLSKVEPSPNSEDSLESLIDMAVKTGLPKIDDKMMEALISATQKQSLEPLLKIPQYSQMLKNSVAQGSSSPVKNISQNEISQALQFLEDLRSDIKVLEAKNQLNPNSVLEQFAQKSGIFQPYQELYQQKINLIRRLKRHHQIMPNDLEATQGKLLKLSPTSESKKLSPTSESKKLSPTSESKKLSPTSESKKLSPISESKKLSPISESKKLSPISESQKLSPISESQKLSPISESKKLSPISESKKLCPTSESKKNLSPTSESKKKFSPTLEQKPKSSASEEATQYKTSIDKTLSQIQLLEFQARMLAAQNYKNLPALLQYYNRAFCPMSPTKSSQQKAKPSSHSPNSSKSPQGLSSPSGNMPLLPANSEGFFNSQNYLINAGLNSEMTYHQMFQSYLHQQEQLNQVKLPQVPKKPVKFSEISAKSLQEKYYVPQATAKKLETNNSVAPTQKT